MSNEAAVRAEKSIAVTAIGILTILWGGFMQCSADYWRLPETAYGETWTPMTPWVDLARF
jgi:hypothetical protein